MAYGNYLASVSENEITNLAAQPTELLDAHKIEIVSHLVAYWVKVQPLGRVLGEAIDGGNVLSEALWHPLRRPKYTRRIELSLSIESFHRHGRTPKRNIRCPILIGSGLRSRSCWLSSAMQPKMAYAWLAHSMRPQIRSEQVECAFSFGRRGNSTAADM